MSASTHDRAEPIIASRRSSLGGVERRGAAAFTCLGLLMLLAAAMWLWAGRDMNFFQDEWTWIMQRRGGGLDALLLPHNEHLSLLPVLVYKATWAVFGLDGYLPYRLEVLALHLVSAGLLFVLVARRLGLWAGVLAAGFLLFLGAAWDGLMWGFQMGMVGSTTAGLGALLALDRRDRLGDVVAALLLLCALASTGLGLAVLAGVAVELAWRREWPRLWIVGAPLLLYLIWYADYGFEVRDSFMRDNLFDAPQYVVSIASAAAGGLLGPGPGIGQVLVVNAFIAFVAALALGWRLPARFAGVVAALLAFWLLTALTRAHLEQADASRYVYFGGAYLLLAIACAVPPVELARPVLSAAAVVLIVAVAFNVGVVRFGAGENRKRADLVSAETGALQLAGTRAPADYVPDARVLPDVTAGAFRETVGDLGQPGYSAAELADAGGEARAQVDRILVQTGQISLSPAAPKATGSGCSDVAAGTEIPVPAEGVRLRASLDRSEVRARLYSDPASAVLIGAVEPRSTVLVRPQALGVPAQWRAVSTASLRACPANG
jgi:hypothetical protein